MKVVYALVLLLIVSVVSAIYFAPEAVDKLIYYSICNQPIKYKIETVDPRFNVSKEEFLQDTKQASYIWNDALKKELFIHDPKGNLSINLIYDERQSLTTQIDEMESTVKSEKESLNPKIREFQRQSAEFRQKVAELNKEIDYWNSQEGAPPQEYEKIIAKQQELKTEAERLNTMAQNLNISTNEYNQQVAQLNETVKSFNRTLDEKPEGGVFKGPEYRIEIYFNSDKAEAIHTLAHELGHALSLKHTADPESLMYYKTHEGLEVTEQDLAELEIVCRKQSILELYQKFIKQMLINYKLWDLFPKGNSLVPN